MVILCFITVNFIILSIVILCAVILSVIILSVITQNFVMLNIVILSVVMQSVVVPLHFFQNKVAYCPTVVTYMGKIFTKLTIMVSLIKHVTHVTYCIQ